MNKTEALKYYHDMFEHDVMEKVYEMRVSDEACRRYMKELDDAKYGTTNDSEEDDRK